MVPSELSELLRPLFVHHETTQGELRKLVERITHMDASVVALQSVAARLQADIQTALQKLNTITPISAEDKAAIDEVTATLTAMAAAAEAVLSPTGPTGTGSTGGVQGMTGPTGS